MSTAATTSNAQSKPTMQMTSLIPLALVGIVLLMVIPLPPFMLDLLLASSIALSVSLLLIALNLEKLDLSAFPTILLFATLLRLSLNVASTRLILLDGHQGLGAAGNIIRAFGEFMIGGNFVVGGAVFILLVIINFVVITKGAGRVAEVSARFTLDALPGKQMSIDADLSAGALTQDEARTRRKEVEQESDFFGAMDGASKFVRGDAIAGLLMTGFNITVGFIVGVMQNDMSAGDAAGTYTLLTVGDGLVSQDSSPLGLDRCRCCCHSRLCRRWFCTNPYQADWRTKPCAVSRGIPPRRNRLLARYACSTLLGSGCPALYRCPLGSKWNH